MGYPLCKDTQPVQSSVSGAVRRAEFWSDGRYPEVIRTRGRAISHRDYTHWLGCKR